jgi:hypothetical protein
MGGIFFSPIFIYCPIILGEDLLLSAGMPLAVKRCSWLPSKLFFGRSFGSPKGGADSERHKTSRKAASYEYVWAVCLQGSLHLS